MVTCGRGFLRAYPLGQAGQFQVKEFKENTFYLESRQWNLADTHKDKLWLKIVPIGLEWLAVSECGTIAVFQSGQLKRSVETKTGCLSVLSLKQHVYLGTSKGTIEVYKVGGLQVVSSIKAGVSPVHTLLHDTYKNRLLS